MSGRRRSRRGGHGGDHPDERWLLTYADMITLLMALFMVLFSISSVNTSKFKTLQRALQDAFSGRILPGGKSVQEHGGSESTKESSPSPPIPSITAMGLESSKDGDGESLQKEDEDFKKLKESIDAFADKRKLGRRIQTVIARRGLVIRILTDDVLFDTGQADLKPSGRPLLGQVAHFVATEGRHPVAVEGHTDPRPISTSRYPTNWELSTARAASVVRFLAGHGVLQQRLQATGYAALHPIATNATARGQSRNRRVEIVLLRLGSNSFAIGGPTS